jgi:hypothetical protein
MNWVLGVIGALLGAALAESTPLLGAVLGFCVLFLIGGSARLRSRLTAVEKELAVLRARSAAQDVRTHMETPAAAAPAAATSATPAATSATSTLPREPTLLRESAVPSAIVSATVDTIESVPVAPFEQLDASSIESESAVQSVSASDTPAPPFAPRPT